MKTYYRVMLGQKSKCAQVCFEGNFIGADYGIHEDLSGKLPDAWRDFNHRYIPVYLANRPEKNKIAAGPVYRIKRALAMTRVIDFYRYEISFKLVR